MKTYHIPVRVVALVTLGSGIINMYSVIIHALPWRVRILLDIFPFEFVHVSRIITLLIGFGLVISAINIYKRKRLAYYVVLALASLSIVFHLTKGLNFEEALVSLALLVVVVLSRNLFTVRSGVPDYRNGLLRFGVAVGLCLLYGIAGFWFLDRKDFGVTFHIEDAVRETFKYLAFVGNPNLIPHTRHAHFFLDSLYVTATVGILYSIISLFRPVMYQYRTHPRERALAKEIVETHGRCAMDFFKYWPDKAFFFSSSLESFIAYGVGNSFAVALGDPVGPEQEIEGIIRGFDEYCRDNDWGAGFHQTLPDFLPIYEKLGYRKLKVGDDAVVDLAGFSLDGKDHKAFRHTINKLEEAGIHYEWHEPPIPLEILAKVKGVSDAWLTIPGRRERQFTLGTFEPAYIASSPIAAAVDGKGQFLAFVNQIPSYRRGEATTDLMRRRADSPIGVMDYLFVKHFVNLKQRGYRRFNLGMAPMSGLQDEEEASVEEKALHFFFQRLDFLFSYRGLKQYKAKFASLWEPRYAIYKTHLDLPRMAIALQAVSEIKKGKEPSYESAGGAYEAGGETFLEEP
jgi:phosphatidylglycerol lysyltransferase